MGLSLVAIPPVHKTITYTSIDFTFFCYNSFLACSAKYRFVTFSSVNKLWKR